ncbi:MAG TPA: hypothetical protein VF275_10110 [Gammaproteobacteria bacterium]
MNKKNNDTYHVPEGFHPFTCMDTIRGLTDAIHHYMTEGAGTQLHPSRADQGGLVALIDQLQHHVHQLHAWLIEIENSTSLELPISDADFEALQLKYTGKNEIKEPPPPLYGVR